MISHKTPLIHIICLFFKYNTVILFFLIPTVVQCKTKRVYTSPNKIISSMFCLLRTYFSYTIVKTKTSDTQIFLLVGRTVLFPQHVPKYIMGTMVYNRSRVIKYL